MKKTKFSHKVIAVFLTLNFLTTIIPVNYLFANNNGPGSPEAAGFEPVDATDMVSLSTGDLSYVIPLMSVEDFPISMSYHAGIAIDMEASWVGLGWYLNPGAINRSLTNTPDDWKKGVGVNFNSFEKNIDYYGVTVEVGLPGAASVGVGLNWGGGQGLSGSVSATLGLGAGSGGMIQGGVSGSVNSSGDASVGVGASASIGSFGVGASVSYSLKDQWSMSGNMRATSSDGIGSIGSSFNSNGMFSVNAAAGGGGTNSAMSSSFSQGDASIDAQSSGIALPLHMVGIPITIGFRKTKVKINIKKGFYNEEWGALYSSDFANFSGGTPRINYVSNYDEVFSDYVLRTRSMDTYSTRLPQNEEDFIVDSTKDIENINFTFLGYDNYNVSAQGLMGNMTPRVFQNATVFGKGDRTKNEAGEDLHVFWHHGLSNNAAQRKLGNPDNNYNSNDLYFYFDGQFTSIEKNDASIISSSGNTATNLNDFINEGAHSTTFNNIYGRAKSPNFVEVFTNSQIASGHAAARGLISPSTIPNVDRNNISKFDPDGIGGYKITSPDGKTYHFALPVYHYEQVHRVQIDGQENLSTFDIDNVNEKRQYSRYATHWLLTAVTGSDYVDRPDPDFGNSLNTFNKEDYGYWVELEYGMWSDGFVWRTPYQTGVYDYNTNLISNIEDKDKGSYSFGRKQLYYLDKINTRNKTALFVKDLRYDNIGKNLKFKFSNANNLNATHIGNTGDGALQNSLNNTNGGVYVRENAGGKGVEYKREYSLKLSKIVLVDGAIGKTLSKNTSGNLNISNLFSDYERDSTCSPNWESDYFKSAYAPDYSYRIHNESDVLDVNDVSESFISQNALQVVEFNHSYKLAQNSPSSLEAPASKNLNKGRLTLESVHRKGKGGANYMPPTSFNYYFENMKNISFTSLTGNPHHEVIKTEVLSRKAKVDAWGFFQGTYDGENAIKAWSLKDITLPTGSKIEIDYDEDEYWIEAFARRFWQDGLRFDINSIDSQVFEIRVTKDPNSTLESFSFTDYFDIKAKLSFDFYLCTVDEDLNLGCNVMRNKVNISGNNSISIFSLTAGELVLRLNKTQYLERVQHSEDIYDPLFTLQSGFGKSMLQARGTCPDPPNCSNGYNLVYKLLANKVPENETGGGLRVSELRTIDVDRIYKVTYDYNHPDPLLNRSSGITSYAPIDGLKYVPYQSEIPPPGVMYEYVTMKETSSTGDYYSKTRFRHHVLKPVHNIFNPNIKMEALDANAIGEDNIFWANVTTNYGGLNGSNNRGVSAKKIDININSALLGQIKSIENLNSENQVMSKIENEYINGVKLADQEHNKGYVKETFNSMKTVFKSNSDGTIVTDAKRLLSISSKTEYNNMLKKAITYAGGQKSYVEYSDVDPWLSSFRKSESTMADGSKKQEIRIPAYEKYEGMRSKAIDPQNKNMLTQEAMNITSVNLNGQWKTLDASISTWSNTWSYRDALGVESSPSSEVGIWRKHKNFIWKGPINTADGTYNTSVNESNNYFNWGLGTPTNTNWQNVSEVTRYTHWSYPVEAKDINGNFAASKMADNFSKTVAGGNARYTEMYYSGAEHVLSGNNFEGEVKGASFRSSSKAHSGDYSVKNNTASDKVFEVSGTIGANQTDVSKSFRPGKYKVSLWFDDSDQCGGVPVLTVNGGVKPYSDKVKAGTWSQYNYYVDLTSAMETLNLSVSSTAIGHYFDDFRMHPIYASMNSYVYDKDTDELTYILDANNMATKYVYDPAGRLCKTYVEVMNSGSFTGGFKKVSENEYYYKGIDNPDCGDCCD